MYFQNYCKGCDVMWYTDPYMDEIRETQGYLFEIVALKKIRFL